MTRRVLPGGHALARDRAARGRARRPFRTPHASGIEAPRPGRAPSREPRQPHGLRRAPRLRTAGRPPPSRIPPGAAPRALPRAARRRSLTAGFGGTARAAPRSGRIPSRPIRSRQPGLGRARRTDAAPVPFRGGWAAFGPPGPDAPPTCYSAAVPRAADKAGSPPRPIRTCA